ncbi:MAG: type II secretion system GspH family protein [Verrucomicrobia bacterium]|nr:type II secretion system GspH family protein [Verrucomicrobiota bacterium]
MKSNFQHSNRWGDICPVGRIFDIIRTYFKGREGCHGFMMGLKLSCSIWLGAVLSLFLLSSSAQAQLLLNVDFGVGAESRKKGFAATGITTNDVWNIHSHYTPRFVPGMALRHDATSSNLVYSDGAPSSVTVSVENAPGAWGNSSGDPMYDTYLYSMNGSNIVVYVKGLPPGNYHFYLYGHADKDVTAEQNSVFTLTSGTNTFGPLALAGSSRWDASQPYREDRQFIVFRNVHVTQKKDVEIEVAAGANGVPVLNGLQVSSRGTAPPAPVSKAIPEYKPPFTNVIYHAAEYNGTLTDKTAEFDVVLDVESKTTNAVSAPLFIGDLAVSAVEIPEGILLVNNGGMYHLNISSKGRYRIPLKLYAAVKRAAPWNMISFSGPPAAVGSVTAGTQTKGVQLELLSGAVLNGAMTGADADGEETASINGLIGADGKVSLRWQTKAEEVIRKSFVTADSDVQAAVSPSVIKYDTKISYEILQSPVSMLQVSIPEEQSLIRIEGEGIRDWSTKIEDAQKVLTVQFVETVSNKYELRLSTEQPLEELPVEVSLLPPRAMDVDREAGLITVVADDTKTDINTAVGLRRTNAPDNAVAAYRFHGGDFDLSAQLSEIEPVIEVSDRVYVSLEESRLLVTHALDTSVREAGIYSLQLEPQQGFAITDVNASDIEGWDFNDGLLTVSFANKLIGKRMISVQMEKTFKELPDTIAVASMKVKEAAAQSADIGATPAPGITMKTSESNGVMEIPADNLENSSNELLAFSAYKPDWSIEFSAQRLEPRVVAEVFNLLTMGDGLMGGSAVIRYAIVDQGVREFRIELPGHWKNIEFSGADIRTKEKTNNVWRIGLQRKTWNGYTLVVTYDYQFDPAGALLNIDGAHTLDTERETGSFAITSAANLELTPVTVEGAIRRIDEAELNETDRALVTRPILLAYSYNQPEYELAVDTKRHGQVPLLDAVADRADLKSVLTDSGQMLTEASFMVKNNEKQYQRFRLPEGSEFWSCLVNNSPVKPEKEGDWLMVPLPKRADRDKAFSVKLVYAQGVGKMDSMFPISMDLKSPDTDVAGTYANWKVFVPQVYKMFGFGGNMTVAEGTVYEFKDAWNECLRIYKDIIANAGVIAIYAIIAAVIILAAFVSIFKRGKGVKYLLYALIGILILSIMIGMLLPSLAKAKSKAQDIAAINNLKQIGTAARIYATDHNGRLPGSFEDMKNELMSEKLTIDPVTGRKINYIAANTDIDEISPDSVIAFTPMHNGSCGVLKADGSVEGGVTTEEFNRLRNRGLITYYDSSGRRTAGTIRAENSKPQQVNGERFGLELKSQEELQRQRGTLAGIEAESGVEPASTPRPTQQPAQQRPGGPAGMGGGGFALGESPMASGIRPIRVEVPETGYAYEFKRVMNISGEPLRIKARIMERKTMNGIRTGIQLVLFLVGLVLIVTQLRKSTRSSLTLAIGWLLVIESVVNIFLYWRILGTVMVVAIPLLAACLIAMVFMRFRCKSGSGDEPPDVGNSYKGASPATSSVVFLALCLGVNTLYGAALDNTGADTTSDGATPAVSVVSAEYSGDIGEKAAQLQATLTVKCIETNRVLRLFGEDVVVGGFAASPTGPEIIRRDNGVYLWLPDRGEFDLNLSIASTLKGDAAEKRLQFGLPPALFSEFSLVIHEKDAQVEFPSAVAFRKIPGETQTQIEAVVGGNKGVDLRWKPRMKKAAEVEATVFCENTSVITLGDGVVRAESDMKFNITQGEVQGLRMRLPADQRLVSVNTGSMRTWYLEEPAAGETNAGPILELQLYQGVTGELKVSIVTEKLMPELPARIQLDVPHAAEVQRETGMIGIASTEELNIDMGSNTLQRLDTAELSRISGFDTANMNSAFRYLKPGFKLSAAASIAESEITATVLNRSLVGWNKLNVNTKINYIIENAGVFHLKIDVPGEYEISDVNAPDISQWVVQTNTQGAVLDITLKRKVKGSYSVELSMFKWMESMPEEMDIKGAYPMDTTKVAGYVVVDSDSGIRVDPKSFQDLSEIPPDSVPSLVSRQELRQQQQTQQVQSSVRSNVFRTDGTQRGGLAYKFITDKPAPQQTPWRLSVGLLTVESWVRAEIMQSYTISETMVKGEAQVKYEIANAPTDVFKLKLPSGFKNIDVSGANIRRRDQSGEIWRIELQSKVQNSYTLTVAWEMPRNMETNIVNIYGIQALGVERETGYISVVAEPPLHIAVNDVANLQKVFSWELPDWTGGAPDSAVFIRRYLRPDYRLAFEVTRFSDADVLQALVDNAELLTVVSDDGQYITKMNIQIRNSGKQYLELVLNTNSDVWSTFVSGQAVQPSRRDNQLMLPLVGIAETEETAEIELIFVGTNAFPEVGGSVEFESPLFNLPLKNVNWIFYMPDNYKYTDFSGSMELKGKSFISEVVSSSYSAYDYIRQEEESRARVISDLKAGIKDAEQELREGKLGKAMNRYQMVQSKAGGEYDVAKEDISRLKSQLKKAQSSNLIVGQQQFNFENAQRMASQPSAQARAQGQTQREADVAYDEAVAQEQWSRLQKSQEIAQAKIMPLRINLPTVGAKLSFHQVLQTELGKPVIVRFDAENTQKLGWPSRILSAIVFFVVLWALVALLTRSKVEKDFENW